MTLDVMALRNKAPIAFLFMSTPRIIGFGRFETHMAVFNAITYSFTNPTLEPVG